MMGQYCSLPCFELLIRCFRNPFKEIILNFGNTVETAKANPAPWIVIMSRTSNDIKDTVPHLVLWVTDMKATAAAIKAAGGTVDVPGYS